MKKFFCYGLLALFLMACSSLPTHEVEGRITAHETNKVMVETYWRLIGRLSMRNDRESWFTSVEWRHNQAEDYLILSTTLGGVVAKLRYASGVIVLLEPDKVERIISEQELESLLGYSPPIQHLKFWVRGIPSPMLSVQFDMAPVGVRRFLQDGWRVNLERFGAFDDGSLPGKMSISKAQVKIKIVVDQWLG
ncbi:MAG: outer membrane lipoprotein LolB [Cycloclasticus sp.]|nr:outer membrane lipoprotein LolB [Cycloclasticus sp.]